MKSLNGIFFFFSFPYAAWEVSTFGFILVRILPRSDWIQTRITANTDTFYAVLCIERISNVDISRSSVKYNILTYVWIKIQKQKKHICIWTSYTEVRFSILVSSSILYWICIPELRPSRVLDFNDRSSYLSNYTCTPGEP